MKKVYISIAAIALGLGGYFIFPSKEVAKSVDSVSALAEGKSKSERLVDQIKTFPGLAKPNLSEAEKNSRCKGAIESIETIPLDSLVYSLNQGVLNLNADCLFTARNDIALLKGFPEVCAVIENGQASKECIDKLFLYKVLRIHHATINENLENLPTEVVINKLLGLLVENAFETTDGLRMLREVGAKLYERLPSSESAAKAAVVGFLADDKLSAEGKREFAKIIVEARQRFPENWELYEMDLVRKKSDNEEGFKNEVANFYKQNPNSAIGAYYMACVKWSESNAAEAKSLFQFAVNKVPSDARFVDTLQKAQTLIPPEKICAVQIGFDPRKF